METPAKPIVGHTPGPWHLRGGTEIGPVGRNFPVAQALSPFGPRRKPILTEAEIDANACLISAAPELLAACKLAVGELDNAYQRKAREEIEEAIAKAEGRNP